MSKQQSQTVFPAVKNYNMHAHSKLRRINTVSTNKSDASILSSCFSDSLDFTQKNMKLQKSNSQESILKGTYSLPTPLLQALPPPTYNSTYNKTQFNNKKC